MGRPKKIKTDNIETSPVAEVKTVKVNNERLANLRKVIAEANRKYGKNTIVTADSLPDVERIPIGIKALDDLIGGGIPCGRFSIVWGGKSCGKSTAILNLIASAQKLGKICALIDAEASFDKSWAVKQGVKLEELVLMQGYATAEDALDNFIDLMKSKSVDLLVIDSVSALSPKGEQETAKGKEKSIADDEMALMARKLSKFFRISTGYVARANCAIVLIGQTRTNLGGFVAFESLAGGNALAHYASLILNFKRGPKSDSPTEKIYNDETEENDTVIIGFDSNVRIDKTKIESCIEGSQIHQPFLFESGFLEPKKDTK